MARADDLVKVLSSPQYWMIKCCCITPLIIITFLLRLISYDPSFSIQNFYVPDLNKFINTTTLYSDDSFIFFDLELQNVNKDKGIRYGPVNLTFSYAVTNYTSMPIGTYTVGGFYQGKGKKAQRRDVAEVTGGMSWEEAAMRALSSGSTADFRVDLVTDLKFKNDFWYSKKKRIAVGGRVEVNDFGKKVTKQPVKLIKSSAPGVRVGLLVVASLLVSFFLLK